MDGPKTTGIIYYTPHYELKSIDGMTKAAIQVLSCIIASITMKNGQWPFCFASYSVLGASTGYSISSVAKAVSVLKKLGLVIVQKMDGGVNAIYPTENVRKCLSFFPANARLSCTFREHELLYGQRHGRPYRPNPERNERIRREHARAIEEGAARLNLQYNNIANAQHIGESPVSQGNAVTSLMQTQVVDDDGCGNQEFFVSSPVARCADGIKKTNSRQWNARKSDSRNAKAKIKPVEIKRDGCDLKAIRDAVNEAKGKYECSPVAGMSPSVFGIVRLMQQHDEWFKYLCEIVHDFPVPTTCGEVMEWSKIPSLMGPRARRAMSDVEADEFLKYNEKHGWKHKNWYKDIADFIGYKSNRGFLDTIPDNYTVCAYGNFTPEDGRQCQDYINSGYTLDEFLEFYKRQNAA